MREDDVQVVIPSCLIVAFCATKVFGVSNLTLQILAAIIERFLTRFCAVRYSFSAL